MPTEKTYRHTYRQLASPYVSIVYTCTVRIYSLYMYFVHVQNCSHVLDFLKLLCIQTPTPNNWGRYLFSADIPRNIVFSQRNIYPCADGTRWSNAAHFFCNCTFSFPLNIKQNKLKFSVGYKVKEKEIKTSIRHETRLETRRLPVFSDFGTATPPPRKAYLGGRNVVDKLLCADHSRTRNLQTNGSPVRQPDINAYHLNVGSHQPLFLVIRLLLFRFLGHLVFAVVTLLQPIDDDNIRSCATAPAPTVVTRAANIDDPVITPRDGFTFPGGWWFCPGKQRSYLGKRAVPYDMIRRRRKNDIESGSMWSDATKTRASVRGACRHVCWCWRIDTSPSDAAANQNIKTTKLRCSDLF